MSNIDEIKERVTSAEFLAAVRVLECVQTDKPRLGRSNRLKEEPVRLSQSPSLGFQASSLSELQENNSIHAFRLFCNCLGLLGTNGPLPMHFTEHALQRASHNDDPAFRDFVDIFNHRMLSLFYRSMAENDPAINLDREDDNRYADFVAAIGGFLSDAARSRDTLPKATKYNYAGWLGSRTRCPDGLVAVVSSYFNLPCAVTEFVGCWLQIPRESVISLGSKDTSCALGVSSYCGRRVWSSSHKIRIALGPMSWEDYISFAPHKKNTIALQELVKSYLGSEIDWELELKLKVGESKKLLLNGRCLLGFNSWLTGSGANDKHIATATHSRQQLQCAPLKKVA